jgi:ferritin-like protein
MPEHAGYHEPLELLNPATIERHRAIVSLMEELEAVDWYDQRVDATSDESLRAVLAHNRDEEKEHAAMSLEWLRRNDPKWDDVLRTYLFKEAPITSIEAEAEGKDG